MIWCVEDDSSIRDIEVYALTSTGFEAKGFEDGDSFWNALQSEKPELIVLDVMLPGRDGVTLLKLMKANEAFRDILEFFGSLYSLQQFHTVDSGEHHIQNNQFRLLGLQRIPKTVTVFKAFGFKSSRSEGIYFNIADAGIILYTPYHLGTSLRFLQF